MGKMRAVKGLGNKSDLDDRMDRALVPTGPIKGITGKRGEHEITPSRVKTNPQKG